MTEARLNIRVSPEFLERLRQASEEKGLTVTAFVTSHLTAILDGCDRDMKDEITELKDRLARIETQLDLQPVGGR